MACASSQRSKIDEAIVSGESIRSLEKRFDISATALRRHKAAHLSPALVAVAQETGAQETRGEVLSLIERLRRLGTQAEAVLAAAVKDKQGSLALAAIREIRANLELLGKATGELRAEPTVSVNLQASPEWTKMRASIVAAIPPELRQEVARQLSRLDA